MASVLRSIRFGRPSDGLPPTGADGRFLLLVLVLVLMACGGKGGRTLVAGPVDQVVPALVAVEGIAGIVADAAQLGGEYVACVAGRAVGAGAAVAREAVVSGPDGVIPGVSVDVSGCLGESRPGVEVDGDVDLAVSASLGILRVLLTAGGPLWAREDCLGHAWAVAALAYLDGVAPVVLEELRAPDGVVLVPSVVAGVGVCL